jgi:hypothetical protein
MPAPGAADTPRWLWPPSVTLIAAAIVIGWGARLSWGLWLDETIAPWQAEAGWAIARDKLADGTQSVLFGYLEALVYFPASPRMELWLRVPALLGGIASCLLAHRLAEQLVGRGTGLPALLAMVGSPQMIIHATQARPYTLAVAAALASLLGLARWLETRRRRHGLLFSLALALCGHLNVLFAAFAVVPAVLVYQHARRGLPIDWRALSRWVALTAVLLAPLVPLLSKVAHGPDTSALGLPPLGQALRELLPGTVLVSLVAFAFLLVPTRGRPLPALREPTLRPPLVLATVWLLVPPLLLFAGSRLVHRTLFIERYFLHTVAAQALLVAILFRSFPPALRALALAACFLIPPIQIGVRTWSWTDGVISWRRPLQTIRTLDPAGVAPVFLQSGHMPSNAIDWQNGIAQRNIYWSPLVAYPLPNRVYPLPYALDDSVPPHVRRLADTELARSPALFVVGLPRHEVVEWVRRFFESRGYTSTFAMHEGFWVLALRRATPAP